MANQDPTSFEAQANRKQQGSFAAFLSFLLQNKKWWLTPIIVLLLAIGALVVLGGSGVAPFIYSLF